MANITRYSPFTDLMEDMFRNFMSRPVHFLEDEAGIQMRTDVSEDDKSYTLKAEIPGVKKEDIHVGIDGNRVSISAEIKKSSEEKEGSKLIRSERYYGKAYRGMTLDSDIDPNAADASYADGVLTLTLPKKAGGTAKKLVIK